MLFVRAYPRETQEMVFDAHNRGPTTTGGKPRSAFASNTSTRRPGNRQIANAAPNGNPTTAATAVAEKLTVRESATVWARVAVSKDFQTSNTGICHQQVSGGRTLHVVVLQRATISIFAA
jgi:hypothetical protein